MSFAVVYVTDIGFSAVTCASIHSLVTASKTRLNIFVLGFGLDKTIRTQIQKSLALLDAHIEIIEAESLTGMPKAKSLPVSSYGRMLLDAYIPHRYERLLYIDGDTWIDLDLTPLIQLDMREHTLGAVLDFGRILSGYAKEDAERLNFSPKGQYFNSGVLLVDYKKWREATMGTRAITVLQENPQRFKQGDQCALNYACKGQWLPLNARWNYQGDLIILFPKAEIVRHYISSTKPWMTDKIRYPLFDVKQYQTFFTTSPFPLPKALHHRSDREITLKVALRCFNPRLLGRYFRLKKLVRHYNRTAFA